MSLDHHVVRILPKRIAMTLTQALRAGGGAFVQTIRIRRDKPLSVDVGGEERLLSEEGRLEQHPTRPLCPSHGDLEHVLSVATQGSYYAVESELRRGYLTLPGGHRLGIAGEAVLEESGLRTIRHLTSIQIRVAHEVKGCADPLMPQIMEPGRGRPFHTLIVGPPGSGKTTILRDLARQLADGTLPGVRGFQVAIADERSEIAGTYRGEVQLDVGQRTDVLDGAPKALAMRMLVRSMAPEVIVTDEIGLSEDADAVADVLRCGVTLIASAHGASLKEVTSRPLLRELIQAHTFQRLAILSRRNGVGTLERVVDLSGGLRMDINGAQRAQVGRWSE